MTLTESPPVTELLLECQRACLKKIKEKPNDRRYHNAILDLYLEAQRQLNDGTEPGYVLIGFSTRLRDLH